MPSIKDNIKEHLENLIIEEEEKLNYRIQVNETTGEDNYDTGCEKRFLEKLKEFTFSL